MNNELTRKQIRAKMYDLFLDYKVDPKDNFRKKIKAIFKEYEKAVLRENNASFKRSMKVTKKEKKEGIWKIWPPID